MANIADPIDRSRPYVQLFLGKGHAVKVEGQNYQGQGCSLATKRFADVIGGQQEVELKPEYGVEPEVLTQPVSQA